MDLAQWKNLFGLVLVSPFTNSSSVFDTFPWLAKLFVRNNNNFIETSFRNLEKAANIKDHTLVIHGTADNIIPFRMGKQIFEVLPGDKKFLSLDGAEHNNFGYADISGLDKLYWSAIEEMLSMPMTE